MITPHASPPAVAVDGKRFRRVAGVPPDRSPEARLVATWTGATTWPKKPAESAWQLRPPASWRVWIRAEQWAAATLYVQVPAWAEPAAAFGAIATWPSTRLPESHRAVVGSLLAERPLKRSIPPKVPGAGRADAQQARPSPLPGGDLDASHLAHSSRGDSRCPGQTNSVSLGDRSHGHRRRALRCEESASLSAEPHLCYFLLRAQSGHLDLPKPRPALDRIPRIPKGRSTGTPRRTSCEWSSLPPMIAGLTKRTDGIDCALH